MRILSIGKVWEYNGLKIDSIELSQLPLQQDIESYNYIIINGGDGSIRRVMKTLQDVQNLPPFILNPTGSFNVVAKLHRVPKLELVLSKLEKNEMLQSEKHHYFTLNDEVFLFSAGNMGDLQHIFLSETLRFGILKKGIAKYILSVLFLFPVHIIMTPFMLLSPRRFIIFIPASFIAKFGSFYGRVETPITIDLENGYNLIELDGDVVTVEESVLKIKPARHILLVI